MVRTLSIHNVPKELRAEGAADTRKQLLQLLSNPHLSSTQRSDLQERLRWVGKREALSFESLETNIKSKPAIKVRVPQHHTVDLLEALSVDEA
jgi:hypothetical protein